MSRQTLGERLSERLHRAEAALDHALAEVAGLTAALPGARNEALLSATTGQKAFTGAAACVASLTEARAHLIETHKTLGALARRLGLEAVAIGPLDKPEDDTPVGGGIDYGSESRAVLNKPLPA